MSKLLPGAIEIAMQEDIEFRKGLPINYLLNNGVAFDSDKVNQFIRASILSHIRI